MIEVRQVRILPSNGLSLGGSSGSMDDDEGYDEEMDEEDEGGYGGPASFMPVSVSSEPEREFPYDMTVEVYGLIYIYNPPQADKLGVDQVDENTVIDGEKVLESDTDDALPAPGDATETPAAPTTTDQPAAGTEPPVAPPTAITTP